MNFTGNIIFLLLLTVSVSAFTVTQTSYSYRTSTTAVRAETESRRAFMSTALGIAGFSFAASRAFADKFEDFSTPSEEPKDEKTAMEERIRRKAELQKKAGRPTSFTEGLKVEREKQNMYKDETPAERRNRLCEELGRGC